MAVSGPPFLPVSLCNNPHICLLYAILPTLYFYLENTMIVGQKGMKDCRGDRAAVVNIKENANQLFFSQKARGKGVLHVRVMVKGLGPGRKVGVRVSFHIFLSQASSRFFKFRLVS